MRVKEEKHERSMRQRAFIEDTRAPLVSIKIVWAAPWTPNSLSFGY
jgi:hypothetical protein